MVSMVDQMVDQNATGLSPVILGAVRDVTCSYTPSLFTAAAFITLSAILFSRLPKFVE